MRKLWILGIAILAIAACNTAKNELDTAETKSDIYLIFGKYHGHCAGECTTLYKLDSNQLFADDLARFEDWENLAFKSTPLSEERYQSAKSLLDAFPPELLNVTEETIGCPDCADQGGFVIEIRKDGVLRHWRVDTQRQELPDYLKKYVDKIDAQMEELR